MSCPRTRTITSYMYREDGGGKEGDVLVFHVISTFSFRGELLRQQVQSVEQSTLLLFFNYVVLSFSLLADVGGCSGNLVATACPNLGEVPSTCHVSLLLFLPSVSDSAGNCFDSASNILEYPLTFSTLFSVVSPDQNTQKIKKSADTKQCKTTSFRTLAIIFVSDPQPPTPTPFPIF